MSKIDPRLKFLQQETQERLAELESLGQFAVEVAGVPSPRARVMIQYDGNLADIQSKGFEPNTIAGDVASGVVELTKLDDIAALPNVVKIESSRPMTGELNISMPEISADHVHSSPPGFRGAGVIVGIIDSGIDFTHEVFRRADGTSRILAIWDQGLTPNNTESSPAGYSYGVEYTKTDIDTALAAADPFSVVRHTDSGHGTHVAGIAAGDGSVAGNGQPTFTFVGVAPEVDIIVVRNNTMTPALGDSANTLDAVNYIFSQANAFGRPVVINLSQGDNLGPHDGTSLLERGIDNLLGGPGNAMVKSAGNAADDDIHARGIVGAGQLEEVRFVVPEGDAYADTIDIWYSGTDQFDIVVTSPVGQVFSSGPGTTTNGTLPNGNGVFIDSVLGDPNNHDNRIYIVLSRGTASTIAQGTWAFTLHGVTVSNGRFDAWIERGFTVPSFVGPHVDNSITVSVPGTSDEIITVASYITAGTNVGNISPFSSIGPTRDGRQKPDVAAPGQRIWSSKAYGSGTNQYLRMAGTSMAAPHVAGAIALMLQKNRHLTQAQIKHLVANTARKDAFVGSAPNNIWGHGKLNAHTAWYLISNFASYVGLTGGGGNTLYMRYFSGYAFGPYREVGISSSDSIRGWSWDGTTASYAAVKPDGRTVIYIRPFDGSTFGPYQEVGISSADRVRGWSWDGTTASYAGVKSDGRTVIYIRPFDGSTFGSYQEVGISSSDSIRGWSWDGKWASYAGVKSDGRTVIYIRRFDGSTFGPCREVGISSADRVRGWSWSPVLYLPPFW